MGASSSKENKKINISKKTSKKKKLEESDDFEVKFFSEDEDSSGTFSLNNNSNKSYSENDDKKSTKSKQSIAEIRVFDYSSDDSESPIEYQVIDLDPPKKEPKKKESIKKIDPPKKSETPQKKPETPKKEETPPKKEETPPKKEETPKKEEPIEPKKQESPKIKKSPKYKTYIHRNKKKFVSKREPIIEQEEEEESSEFESEEIDSPHPSIIIESNMKENIYSEYNKNKNYYDKEEKNISEKINKDSYDTCPKNKFRKKTLLHDDEITSICTLDGLTKQISYATSSLDNTIKFWTGKFKLIDSISNLLVPSLYLCEFDFINILSAEGVYIKMYDLESEIYECKHIFRNHIDIIKIIYPLVTKDCMNFISGGKDKIMRLWSSDNENNPLRYYEGHKNTILDISTISYNKKLMVSISEDKKCIIWEINNSNMIHEFDLYFTPFNLIETKDGFGIGGYDNKIRLYYNNIKNYELKKCIITKFYGNKILFGDDDNIFSLDATGNINLIDIIKKEILISFESNNSDFVKIIKSYDWNPNKDEYDSAENKNRFGEDRIIIGINKDGNGYTFKSELFKKLKIYPNENYRKKEENEDRKNDKGKTFIKKKIKRKQSIVKPKDKRASVGYNQMINI